MPYFVWKRGDGYVSSSKTSGQTWRPTANNTFEVLGKYEDWASARDLIAKARLETPGPFCGTKHWADSCPTSDA